jgi:hypothetical protein
MRALLERAGRGVFLGLCVALAGCSTTKSIRPDQLPILTDAAARPLREPLEVTGVAGETVVRVEGTLEDVEVTLGAGLGGRKTFHAPIISEVRGPMLFIRDNEGAARAPLALTEEVKVTYGNKTAKLAVGVTLDILASPFLVFGTLATILGAYSHAVGGGRDVDPILYVYIGVPVVLVGSGILIPGIFLTRSGAHRPKYPQRPVSRVMAGPGGVRVSF